MFTQIWLYFRVTKFWSAFIAVHFIHIHIFLTFYFKFIFYTYILIRRKKKKKSYLSNLKKCINFRLNGKPHALITKNIRRNGKHGQAPHLHCHKLFILIAFAVRS